jgi:hypothetical protein
VPFKLKKSLMTVSPPVKGDAKASSVLSACRALLIDTLVRPPPLSMKFKLKSPGITAVEVRLFDQTPSSKVTSTNLFEISSVPLTIVAAIGAIVAVPADLFIPAEYKFGVIFKIQDNNIAKANIGCFIKKIFSLKK